MLMDAFNVLTCSNLDCITAPLWYQMAQNWAAHGFLGVLLAAILPRRWLYATLALLAAKEGLGDIARNPGLAVLLDSAADVAATVIGARMQGQVSFLKSTKTGR